MKRKLKAPQEIRAATRELIRNLRKSVSKWHKERAAAAALKETGND